MPGILGSPARSSLMVRSRWLCPMLGRVQCSARGWTPGFFGKANSRQKRGPAAGRRRRGAPRGAGILETECSHTETLERPLARHTLDYLRERKKKLACPGPQTTRAMTRDLMSVVPAKAGTYTPRRKDFGTTEVAFLAAPQFKRGGYGSPLSRGRQIGAAV